MTYDPSAVSREALGGLYGGPGFTAQTVVLLHRLPRLLEDPDFMGCILEGLDDFDLHFDRGGQRKVHLVQCKGKPLGNSEVRELMDGMYRRQQSDPQLYEAFEIVARAFPAKVEGVRVRLHRQVTTHVGYAGTATDAATAQKVDERIQDMLDDLKCNEPISINWVRSFLSLSTDIPSYPFDDADVVDLFATRCADCRQFGVQILAPFRLAAAKLHQHLELHRSEFHERTALARLIHDVCRAYQDKVQQDGVRIHLDHWRDVDGKAIIQADEVIRWREAYEAARPSGIPERAVTEKLLHELQSFESRTMSVWKHATVELMHPCSVSAAVAFGQTYRLPKGYKSAASVPNGTWTFGADMSAQREAEILVREGQPGVTAIVAVGVGRNLHRDVRMYAEKKIPEDVFLVLRSKNDHLDERQARRLASDVIRELRDLYSEGIRITHLFFAGPMALAAMIGSLLNQVGDVLVYELDYERNYQPVFLLST